MKKRMYFLKHGAFANMYDVRWSYEDKSSDRWVRISRKEAIKLIASERRRRKYDKYFSGYSTRYILPYDLDCYGDRTFNVIDGYIAEASV